MARYIDADLLIKNIANIADLRTLSTKTIGEAISNTPTADVTEVKHGRNMTKNHPVDEFICSECGLILEDYTRVKIDEDTNDRTCYEYELKFCPECGAKIKDFWGAENG